MSRVGLQEILIEEDNCPLQSAFVRTEVSPIFNANVLEPITILISSNMLFIPFDDR